MNYEKLGLLVADQITAMLAYWDKNLVCRYANKAYLEWFGRSADKMIDTITLKELLGPLYEKNFPHIQLALNGQKQVFEREITLPNGTVRQTLANYIPDIQEGQVQGFFVHVADVTYLKQLEKKVIQLKKEMLANIIQAQENEKSTIADLLRDSINQTLVCARVMISNPQTNNQPEAFLPELGRLIHEAIEDLKAISISLSPSLISDLGFTTGVRSFLDNFSHHNAVPVNFHCNARGIDQLDKTGQITVFRIIQNFLMLATKDKSATGIQLNIDYNHSNTILTLTLSGTIVPFEYESKEWKDLQSRVEYLSGELRTFDSSVERGLTITIPTP